MATRKERLKKLVSVQEQLKALHEMRRAGFLGGGRRAPRARPPNCAERFDAEGSLSALFPEIYHRRIDQALMRRREATSSSPATKPAASPRRPPAPTWSNAPIARSAGRTSATAPTASGSS